MNLHVPLPGRGYYEGDTTKYQVSLSCTNGYFRTGALKVALNSGVYYLRAEFAAEAGSAAGTCVATTWDWQELGLDHARTTFDGRGARPSWALDFLRP